MIVETLWTEDIESVGARSSGHTLVCADIDDNGTVELVDLRFRFAGDLSNIYQETQSLDGTVVSDTERPVDGSNVPTEIFQTCGARSLGPYYRVTAMQWGAALHKAGFTDIAGDHAIDPVWEAIAKWGGVEFSPLNLFQGDFQPEPRDDAELLDCELGTIQIPRDIPAEARAALEIVANC